MNRPGFDGGSKSWENGAMNKKPSKFSLEVRERAVRLVRKQRNEHPSLWAAVESIAGMIGCTPQTLHEWSSVPRLTKVSGQA